MTTLERIRSDETSARQAVLAALEGTGEMLPHVMFDRVRQEHPTLPVDALRRATWSLISDREIALTPRYTVRLER